MAFDLEAASQHPAAKVGVAFEVAAHKMVSLLTRQVSDGAQYGTKTYNRALDKGVSLTQ